MACCPLCKQLLTPSDATEEPQAGKQRMPRARLSEEEKVKRRAEAQAKYHQAHKEQLREQRQAAYRRYYARNRGAILERNREKRRQDRELLKAAKEALSEGRPLSESRAA